MTSKYPSVILHMAVYAKILVILSRFLVKIWWKVILSICFSRRFLVHSWVWLSSSCTQSCLPWGILLYSAPESKQWKAPKELCPSSVQSYNNQTRQIHSQVRIRNFLKLALCFLCISKFPTSVFTFLQCVFCSGFFSASPFWPGTYPCLWMSWNFRFSFRIVHIWFACFVLQWVMPL